MMIQEEYSRGGGDAAGGEGREGAGLEPQGGCDPSCCVFFFLLT